MKIYVITKGYYSDYHICAVTIDKNKAELLKEKFSDEYWGDAVIEEFDTDEEEEVLKFEKVFDCLYCEENNEIEISEESIDYFRPSNLIITKNNLGLHTYVLANNEEDALKIASDKFSKYRSEKMGL